MKKFEFRLEAVLKYRKTLEELRLQSFAQVQQELRKCEARVTALTNERDRTVQEWPSHADAEDLKRRTRYLELLRERLDDQLCLREAIQQRLNEARDELVEARKGREALDRLREEDQLDHAVAVAREEQAAIDEVASTRNRRAAA